MKGNLCVKGVDREGGALSTVDWIGLKVYRLLTIGALIVWTS